MYNNRRQQCPWHEVKAVYEDEDALFILTSCFNQFARGKIVDIFQACNKEFYASWKILMDEQARTKTQPKVAVKPIIPSHARRKNDESPPVKDRNIYYKALTESFNFAKATKWKEFDLRDEKHLRILKGSVDPISLEDLLEVGMGGKDTIIQMPCATKKMRCNFTHKSIVSSLMARPECPVCKTNYEIPGKQPTGTMSIKVDNKSDCAAYRGDGTIVITFSFPNGTQGLNHRKPGESYAGTTRVAYLPHVEDGKQALKLLIKAFQRGELFTVDDSLTTGAKNQVTFGSIHLKTNKTGGTAAHGWPDNTYFTRLREECAGKMIFDDKVEAEMKSTQKKATFNKII